MRGDHRRYVGPAEAGRAEGRSIVPEQVRIHADCARGRCGLGEVAEGDQLLERACDAQMSNVCVALGDRYRLGDPLPKNPAKAAALYKKACDQTYSPGCDALKKLDAK